MIARFLVLLVKAYQVTLSPVFGGACRYSPSCSAYACDAITRHGAWRGGRLAVGRLFRCHPFARAGYDPVPQRDDGGPGRGG